MPTVISMPKLSDSMEEGVVAAWLVADGGEIEDGAALAEIESDKATTEFAAAIGGVVRHAVREGGTVRVGDPIAAIFAIGEEVPGGTLFDSAHPAGAPAEPPAAAAVVGISSDRDGDGGDAEPFRIDRSDPNPFRISATPVARRLARELNVELNRVSGTGPHSRIRRADVVAAHARANGAGADRGTFVPFSRIQRIVAERMELAAATVPVFELRGGADIRRLELLRTSRPSDAPTVSVTHCIIKACALALVDFPRVNGVYDPGGGVRLKSRVNIGMAVDARGELVVPTIFDADKKSVETIARDASELVARSRAGRLGPSDLEGGTFTVTNLGMLGVLSFTPIINPGQTAILAVGTATERVVFDQSSLTSRREIELSLVCDHRVVYGAEAARFLGRICDLLDGPDQLGL